MASRQWRNYIHSAPILWDCIVVRGNRGDAVAHVVRGLKLSGDRPLTVILEVWPSLWKKIHPYFLGHRDRIMTFIPLMGDAEPGEGDIRVDGIDMIRDLAPLPNLRTVNGDLGYSNIKDTVKGIFNQSHSLECLKNFSFDPESLLEAQRNIALQEFHTYEELASLLSVLEKMPSIRKSPFHLHSVQ
ncbi:hypothetical protein CPB86DRAFT_869330 [Serendipita vermifera]|nr:hypothetical protein CPB86DRAFT_869330 [Serendipita vermifera]